MMQKMHDVAIAPAFFPHHGGTDEPTVETAVVDKAPRHTERAVARGSDRQSVGVLLTGRIASWEAFPAVGGATSAASRLHEAAALSVRLPTFC